MQLAEAGLLTGKPLDKTPFIDVMRVLDPALRVRKVGKRSPAGNKDNGKHPPKRSRKQLDHLAKLLDELGVPDIKPSKEDMQDLEHIDRLTQAQMQLERLKDIEAEIVDTQRWNHDASKELLNLALKGKRIPFETRREMYDLLPTANDLPASTSGEVTESKGKSFWEPSPAVTWTGKTQSSSPSKGKERAVDQSQKRSIYHLLPEDAEESWLRVPGEFPKNDL